ncbi:Na+-transporting NADH:ubiquinone oxidoreductase, subunit NqrB [Gloeomargarita lithophora Alchichica-D10]|uniref:Na+-transporting NADH:ubiquinone oxidoreductase, subunit NqrB n=1 Tax=Gloeomargarita lithophora Alchichica-D10 TaxID=1188229 RepID=A0A1J0A9G9_9CYAN|nr:RnfABCDGE type electron transport complex subunit D [Gloeomargarita lithophora]APB32584.1 Na+-transporting NADH:ubiquinone oxidoreductase, subunit NqrB [Gloeomargarita lithophora Alchichica-D10]
MRGHCGWGKWGDGFSIKLTLLLTLLLALQQQHYPWVAYDKSHSPPAGVMNFDLRYGQIALLLTLWVGGVTVLDWGLAWQNGVLILVTCVLSQRLWAGRWQGWPSAVITGLSLTILLRAGHPGTLVLAAVLAISSKFLLRVGDKHWFNPANFGIVMTLLFTHDAWVNPGQWGSNGLYALVLLGVGAGLLWRARRWETAGAFALTYGGLWGLWYLWLGETAALMGHHFLSGSLVVFTLLMITDPRSTPNDRRGRILWAALVGGVAFIFASQFYWTAAPLWALFFLSPVTILLDQQWVAPRFVWGQLG